jgi:deoxyribonuclease (pyrimidine dimer)
MRCNCGIDPALLADQHLLAEARELSMVAGSLLYNDMKVVGEIPATLRLGKGHINFFKNKLQYLYDRWGFVCIECDKRGFIIKKGFHDLARFPIQYKNNWSPSMADSILLRDRVIWKLKLKPTLYRHCGEYIGSQNMDTFCNKIMQSPLYFV